MLRFRRLSVMLLSPYITQLMGLIGRTIQAGWELLELNVVSSGLLVRMDQYPASLLSILADEISGLKAGTCINIYLV